MSQTIHLTSDEVAQIRQLTNLQDDEAAITTAAREFLRLSRLRELKEVSGKLDFVDVSETMESLELAETKSTE